MKITYIVPGFGGTFYCGNCLRDRTFSKSLEEIGHNAITLPLYLPHSIEEFQDQGDVPVFYGAVNIYLKQNYKVFRNMPKWLYGFFNSPSILKYAAKKSGSTKAEGLEEMTISMLKGADGYQNDELEQLIHYLKYHEKPDVVHLSNALLMGLAARIKAELNVPVLCSLQDEDVWIDAMSENYKPKLWQLMSEKAKDIDAFVAVSQFFADVMRKNIDIPEDKLNIVHIGIDPEAYQEFSPIHKPSAIGFLSRMNEENGFGLLIDSFIELKKKPQFNDVKLKLTGGKTSADDEYINEQIMKLKEKNWLKDVEFIEDFRTPELADFFNKISVLSVPVLKGEAFGLYQLEALCSGIPIVQPDLGAFPEIVEATKGGAIYNPNTPFALAEKLAEVLGNDDELCEMGRKGRNAVIRDFNTKSSSLKLVNIYENVIKQLKNDNPT